MLLYFRGEAHHCPRRHMQPFPAGRARPISSNPSAHSRCLSDGGSPVSANGRDPPQLSDQKSRGDHLLCLLHTSSPWGSEPLAVQFIQAICQLLCLLKSFTALLPAWGYLFLTIISPCNGSCHGGNGVCVSTQRDTVDDGPLQVAVVFRNIWVSFHTAQEGVNCSRDGPQSCDAIAC